MASGIEILIGFDIFVKVLEELYSGVVLALEIYH